MSDDGDLAWNNTHRAFLQCLLSRQTITYEEAKPILAAIQTAQTPERPALAEDISEEDFENYINAIVNAISPFDLEIRTAIHQKSKSRIYALVNTTSDALTQMATAYNADEIAFIRRMLEAMFDTFNTKDAEVMALTSMQAIRLAKAPREDRSDAGTQGAAAQGLTGSQAERVLGYLHAQGWFEKTERTGYYCLSPRALMELKEWLVQTFNDEEDEDDADEDEERYVKIKMCGGCQAIVTIGLRCPNLDCLVRVHEHCARNYFRSHGGRQECPSCKTAWEDPPLVGERAARNRDKTRRSGGDYRTSIGRPESRSRMNMDGATDTISGEDDQ